MRVEIDSIIHIACICTQWAKHFILVMHRPWKVNVVIGLLFHLLRHELPIMFLICLVCLVVAIVEIWISWQIEFNFMFIMSHISGTVANLLITQIQVRRISKYSRLIIILCVSAASQCCRILRCSLFCKYIHWRNVFLGKFASRCFFKHQQEIYVVFKRFLKT